MRRRFANPYIHYEADITANNQIIYTTTDNKALDKIPDVFGATLIQNDYSDGKGVLLFDSEVTSIGDGAFTSCGTLTSITIPNSVTIIGNRAFYGCYNITSIDIPDEVESIGNEAFYGCDFPSIVFPKKLVSIGRSAFQYSALQSVIIPNSVTSLGESCFSDMSSLLSIDFGDGVSSIVNVCLRCENLNTITIGKNITEYSAIIGFLNCTRLQNIVFRCINVPNLLCDTGIPRLEALRTQIRTVTLDPCVETIGSSAFYTWTSLHTVNILGKSITHIEPGAFTDCVNLSYLNLKDQNNLQSIGGFYRCGNSTSEFKIILPDNLIEIKSFCFSSCTKLKDITIPKKVKILNYRTFENCTALFSISLAEGLESIDQDVFINCTALRQINIPSSLNSIENNAFLNVSLDTINLSNIDSYLSILYSGENCYPALNGAVFYLNGNPLKDVISTVPIIPKHAFHWKDNKTGTIETILFKHRFTGTTFGLTEVGDYAFYNCSLNKNSAIEVRFAETTLQYSLIDSFKVETIGEHSFENNRLYWNFNVTTNTFVQEIFGALEVNGFTVVANTIKKLAFKNCKFTTTMNVRSNSVGYAAFYNCKYYDDGSWHDDVTLYLDINSAGEYAFYDNSVEMLYFVGVEVKKLHAVIPTILENTFKIDNIKLIRVPGWAVQDFIIAWIDWDTYQRKVTRYNTLHSKPL